MVIFQIIQKDTSCPLPEESFSLAHWCSRAGSVQTGGKAERLGAAVPGEEQPGRCQGRNRRAAASSCLQLPALTGPHRRLSGVGCILSPRPLLSWRGWERCSYFCSEPASVAPLSGLPTCTCGRENSSAKVCSALAIKLLAASSP